jgi:hypothetical protein
LQTALRLMAALGSVLAPAMTAQLALAQSAYGQVSSPAPYAQPTNAQPASVQTGPAGALGPAPDTRSGQLMRYSGMQVYDRYGGETRHASAAAAPFVGQPATATRATLSWSGKVDAPATPARRAPYADVGRPQADPPLAPGSIYDRPPPVAQPPSPSLATVQAQTVQAQTVQAQTVQAQANQGRANQGRANQAQTNQAQTNQAQTNQGQTNPGQTNPAQTNPAQTNPAQANPIRSDNPYETGPHHYSVHRDYGIEPDPIPLPPQFFGATADLSQPVTSDPIRRSTAAGGKTQNPVQPTDGQ